MGNEYTSGVAMLVLYVRVIDVYVDELDPGQPGLDIFSTSQAFFLTPSGPNPDQQIHSKKPIA